MRLRTSSTTCSSIGERYDLSGVGRMKFNRRVGRKAITGTGILYDQKYFSTRTAEGQEAHRSVRRDFGHHRCSESADRHP
jgi:hypothetical protein